MRIESIEIGGRDAPREGRGFQRLRTCIGVDHDRDIDRIPRAMTAGVAAAGLVFSDGAAQTFDDRAQA